MRNASRRELQPRVGDIGPRRQHGDTDGLDSDDLGRHNRQHHVEVVNHEVEDDIDIEAAIGKCAQAVHLDEPRMIEQRTQGRNRWIEALRMSDSEHGTRGLGCLDHLLRLRSISCERLLHEHADPTLQERKRDAQMRLGRHRNGDGIDVPEHIGRVRERRRVHEAADLPRPRLVDVDDAGHVDVRKRRENPRVVLPQRAYANHCNPNTHFFCVITAETQRRGVVF